MKEDYTFDDWKEDFKKMGPAGKVASAVWMVIGIPIFFVLFLFLFSAGLGLISGILMAIYGFITAGV